MSDVRSTSDELRRQAIDALKTSTKSAEEIAGDLGVFRIGLTRMLDEQAWSMERSVRVLDALGIDVTIASIPKT